MTVRRPSRIVTISGSLRSRSSNTEVLRAVALLAPESVEVVPVDGIDGLPHFNPELDGEGATLPTTVRDLRAKIGSADALLICSPEYAHGVPGTLKNALDWLVSGPEMPDKPVGLLNVSSRSKHAIASLAETLRTMSARLVSGAVITVPLDGRRLDAAAIAADPALAEPLRSALRALIEAAAHKASSA